MLMQPGRSGTLGLLCEQQSLRFTSSTRMGLDVQTVKAPKPAAEGQDSRKCLSEALRGRSRLSFA